MNEDPTVNRCRFCGRAPLLRTYLKRYVISCYQATHKLAVEGYPKAEAVTLWNDANAALAPLADA
jgi:hypothetical protein